MTKSVASRPEDWPPPRDAVRKRTMPPRLSNEHFKSARSAPHSVLGSPNSGLLSPAVSDQCASSPPPRPDTDDYIGSKAHLEHRRRHRTKQVQKPHSTKEENLGSMPMAESYARKPYSEGELRKAENSQRKSESVSRALSGDVPSSGNFTSRTLGSHALEPTPDPKTLVKASSNEPSQSPAVMALRRLSQAPLPNQITMPNATRRISNALSATLKFRRASTSSSSGRLSPEDKLVKSPTRSSLQSSLHGSGDQASRYQGQASRSKLDVPTTITVRKASEARQSDDHFASTGPTISPSSNSHGVVAPKSPPSVELVAFYSEMRRGSSSQHGHTSSHSSVLAPALQEGRHDSIPQLSQYANSRRQSAIADVAITFADVHVAQGTFAAKNISKSTASGPSDIAQRISTVQFRSRNSVHEIIWREDEMTSGSSTSCSSHNSSSPDHSVQFQTIGSLEPDGDASPTRPSHAASKQSNDVPFLNSDLDLNSTEPQAKFLQITWDTSKTATAAEAEKHADAAMKISPITQNSIQDLPQVGMAEKPLKRARGKESGLEGIADVASFPPPPSRQSNSAWCRPPFTDQDNSLVERAEAGSWFANLRTKSVETLGVFTGDVDGQPPARRLSVYAGLPPKTGSSLGISSHRSKPLRRVS